MIGKIGLRAPEAPPMGKKWLNKEVPCSSFVPLSWLTSETEWHDVEAGIYRIMEHIDGLELRAQLRFLEVVSIIPSCRDSYAVGLCDNTVATAAARYTG